MAGHDQGDEGAGDSREQNQRWRDDQLTEINDRPSCHRGKPGTNRDASLMKFVSV
jgi:hypothetical protein